MINAPFLKFLASATEPTSKFLNNFPETHVHFGTVSTKMGVYYSDVSVKMWGSGNIGLTVVSSLNSGELKDRLKMLVHLVSANKILALVLGRDSSVVGGGKSLDTMLKQRHVYKDKITRAVSLIEESVNAVGSNVLINWISSGSHPIPQAELNKKLEYLNIPYRFNIFLPPTEELSAENFPEILSYWNTQRGVNIVLDNWSGNGLFDYLYCLLLSSIITRNITGRDGIDIADIFNKEFKASKTWLLSLLFSKNKYYKKWEWLPEWFPFNRAKRHIDRSFEILSRVVLRSNPKPEDIIFVCGDFSEYDISQVKEIVKQELHFVPRIRYLSCRVLPEEINVLVGKLSFYPIQKVPTPHFEELEFLMSENRKEQKQESRGGIYG